MIALQVITRLVAFIGKEITEVIRRPGAIVSLILGPFIIMAVFGLGYQGYRRPLQTIIVVPPQSGLPLELETYREVATGMEVVEIVPEPSAAEARLRNREIDVVIIAPADAEARFRSGEQSVMEVHINVVDPVQLAYAGFLAEILAHEVNARLIEQAVNEGASFVIEAGQAQALE
ncbi:MAG: hypothetical protein M3R57_05260, partial [Chloroflexota bacterium]|nr:hypothetical protein [Chloroflexota bacterium]